MSKFSRESTIVVDASVAVAAMFPFQANVDALAQFSSWREQKKSLVAPDYFLAECTSAIRKLLQARTILHEEGEGALQALFAFGVVVFPITHSHCRAALTWAARLGQSRIYDALYLAVAEESGAELWTADRRLVNAARQAGVAWVQEVT